MSQLVRFFVINESQILNVLNIISLLKVNVKTVVPGNVTLL